MGARSATPALLRTPGALLLALAGLTLAVAAVVGAAADAGGSGKRALEPRANGAAAFAAGPRCCAGCSYTAPCCCGARKTVGSTRTRTVVRTRTVTASNRAAARLFPEPLSVDSEAEWGPIDADAGTSAAAAHLFARHLCPLCPAGIVPRLNSGANSYCCPRPLTRLKTVTRTRILTRTVKRAPGPSTTTKANPLRNVTVYGVLFLDVDGSGTFTQPPDVPLSGVTLAVVPAARAASGGTNVTGPDGRFSITFVPPADGSRMGISDSNGTLATFVIQGGQPVPSTFDLAIRPGNSTTRSASSTSNLTPSTSSFTPSTSSFTPSTSSFTPSSSSFTPSSSSFTSSTSSFTPSTSSFTPSTSSFTPSTSSFTPSTSSFTPSTSSFTPSSSSFTPSTSSFTPSTSSFTPSTSSFTPSTSSFTPSTSSFTPSTSSFTPSTSSFTPSTSSFTPSTSSDTQTSSTTSLSTTESLTTTQSYSTTATTVTPTSTKLTTTATPAWFIKCGEREPLTSNIPGVTMTGVYVCNSAVLPPAVVGTAPGASFADCVTACYNSACDQVHYDGTTCTFGNGAIMIGYAPGFETWYIDISF